PLEYRLYRHLTSRSPFALRLAGIVSNGNGYNLYPFGGINQLRGFGFREFFGNRVAFMNLEYRFPLFDAIAFPFGIIRDIRGFLFLDVGAAWGGTSHDDYYHPDLGPALSDPTFSVLVPDSNRQAVSRRFKFYDSANHMLGDGKGSYGFGWNFYFGPFQLT